MVQPGVCYNGCCRSQPCMNGGTCVDHCHAPKHKFTCTCPKLYRGKVCEKQYKTSCLDVMKSAPPGTIPANGNYTIMRDDVYKTRVVYCAFVSPNQAWTLLESYSLANKHLFSKQSFYQNLPMKKNSKEELMSKPLPFPFSFLGFLEIFFKIGRFLEILNFKKGGKKQC